MSAGALLLVAALAAAVPPAGGAEGLLAEGIQSYEAGDYPAAAAAFQRILDYGVEHEVVHYNLGNARFKQGRLGEAILSWERALRLDPGDREAEDNLAYAATLTVDRVEVAGPSFPARALRRLATLTSPAEDAWLLLLAVYLLGGVGAWSLLTGGVRLRRLQAYLAAALLGLVLVSGTAWAVKEAARRRPVGVVLADKVDVRSGPSEDNTSLFTVHEGLRVSVRNRREDWVQILLPNGLNGWVPRAAMGLV